MSYISFFIPKDAYFLRNSLNDIADLSEKTGFYNLTARVSSFAIPLFSLFNLLSFAVNGELKGALQLTAFAVMSTGWAVLGLFAGSKILTLWRQVVIKPQIPERELQDIRLINQRLLGNLRDAEQAIPPLEGRIRDLTADKAADQDGFERQMAELREQNRIQREQLAIQQQAIQEKEALLALQGNQILAEHQIVVQNLKDQIAEKDVNVATLQQEIRAIFEEKALLAHQIEGLLATHNTHFEELENIRVALAQKEQEIINLQRDAIKLSQEKETAVTTFQQQVDRLQEIHQGLRIQVRSLEGRVQYIKTEVRKHANKLEKEREENASLKERIEVLTLESDQAKADFERMFQAYNASDKRIDTLEQLNPEKAVKHKKAVDEDILIEKLAREKIEKEKQALLDNLLEWADVSADVSEEELNQSQDGIATPENTFKAFDLLYNQLEQENFGPVVLIQSNLIFDEKRKGEDRDSFTNSVLSYLLLKGYQKYRRNSEDFTLEKFRSLHTKISNICATTPSQNETLETLSLKRNLDICLSVFENPPGELTLDQDETINSVFKLLFQRKTWPKEILRLPFYDKNRVVTKLKTVFGDEAVDDILSFYKLSNGSWSEKEVLALFVGLSANLTLETAKRIFNTENEEQLIQKMTQMRDIVLRFAIRNKNNPNVEWDPQYQKDLESLRVMNLIAHAADERNVSQHTHGSKQLRAAAMEHLGRDLAYCFFDVSNNEPTGPGKSNLKEGTLVVLSGIQKNPLLYQVRIIIRESGIYGVTLVPVNPTKAKEAFFLWRGTYCEASKQRDLSLSEKISKDLGMGGPGAASFKKNEAEILRHAATHLEESKGVEHLTFLGHSLGGSDAARHLASLIEKKRDLFSEIISVELISLNSPHVESEIAISFLSGVRSLPQCFFYVTHLEGKGDGVSLAGTSPVSGSPRERPVNLKSATIIFEQRGARSSWTDFAYFKPHTSSWFTSGSDPTVSKECLDHFNNFLSRQHRRLHSQHIFDQEKGPPTWNLSSRIAS